MDDLQQFILNKLEKLDEKLDSIKEDNASTKTALETHSLRDEQIHQDVKEMSDKMSDHAKLLADYNQQLSVHIKRSELLEKRQCDLEDIVSPVIKKFHEEKAVEKWHQKRWAKKAKMAGYGTAIVGFAYAIIKLLIKVKTGL